MKVLKPLTLSSIALAGVLYISGASNAVAANAVAAPEQALAVQTALPHDLSVPAYYQYHGHHYNYKYNGKYYNHRARKNGKWRYY